MYKICAVRKVEGVYKKYSSSVGELSDVYTIAVKLGLQNGYILENNTPWGTINSDGVIDRIDYRMTNNPKLVSDKKSACIVHGIALDKEKYTCSCSEVNVNSLDVALQFVYTYKITNGFVELDGRVYALIDSEGFVTEL